MKKNFTSFAKSLLGLAFILMASLSVSAQIGCPNETILGTEDFGQGTTPVSDPDVTNLIYQVTGDLSGEGTYRIADSTNQKPEWQVSGDHTGNLNGRMLVVNGIAETFYNRTITLAQGFVPGDYNIGLFIMNVDKMGVCAPTPLLPILSFTVEYLSQSSAWVPLVGSPYVSAPIPQTATPTWVNVGSTFTIPAGGNFIPNTIRVRINDGTVGGCGNDFAIDDMKLSYCGSGGPMPVTFMNFTAQTKGSGVSLNWSTAQEINNSYFEVQRSADGNTNWEAIANVTGAGNSQTVKNYNAFDQSPLSGINYYRIKQVDYDGNYKFSKTVNVKTGLNKTGVSVLANPFFNELAVNFNSATSQMVSARLIDITGRQVAVEKWSVSAGNSRKNFSSISGLQQGMYILSIRNNAGEVLYTGKVIKQ
jgi:hypothetical protein